MFTQSSASLPHFLLDDIPNERHHHEIMPRRNHTQTTQTPAIGLTDLQPAPYNPRNMTPSAKSALEHSLNRFGDISGITFNRRTGHLITGHQRMNALRSAYGDDLRMENGTIITPAGDSYPVRVVDWEPDIERAANVAANSPHLSANFDEIELHALLAQIESDMPGMMHDLRLDELMADVAPPDAPTNAENAESYAREGHASVTYSGPEEKINEIKRIVNEKRGAIAEQTNRAPREVPLTEALHKLLTEPAPANRRR